ncbi:MAG: hypothetical protein Q4C43_10935 [Prevotella sp.]|nr:hypothetical protein [Prevotella sp.]
MIIFKGCTYCISAFSVAVMFCGCNGSKGDVMQLVAERDSLKATIEKQKDDLNAINVLVTTINQSLDSISVQEGLVFVSNSEKPVSRVEALKNLERYEQVLNNQREKIDSLENALKNNTKSDTKELNGLIAHMKAQLAQKDEQIALLRAELSKKDVNLASLRRQVESQRDKIASQTEAIASLDQKTKAQNDALTRQDEMMNQGYVLLGTKKELKGKGIISKKKLVADAALDKSKFTKVDIRDYKEVTFTAKNPKVLTNMPQSSYSLLNNGSRRYTLRITNATAFWSISNYLVIQTD